jgi:hypothetical protein
MINGERMNIFSGEFHPYRSVRRRPRPPLDPACAPLTQRAGCPCTRSTSTSSRRSRRSASTPSPSTRSGVRVRGGGSRPRAHAWRAGLHEPKRGAGIDFSGFRNVTPFVEAAQEAGIYLIARPGPYMCVPWHASRRRAGTDAEQQRGDDRRRVPRLGCVRAGRGTGRAHVC